MYCVPYTFIVYTDSYAGNFNRELCAYITGHWDKETHGGKQAEQFKQEVGDAEELFGGYIAEELTCDDDVPKFSYHCLEGKGATGVGIFFYKKPTHKMISLMKGRSLKFAKEGRNILGEPINIKIVGFKLRATFPIKYREEKV